jgi:hypothetical protein
MKGKNAKATRSKLKWKPRSNTRGGIGEGT